MGRKKEGEWDRVRKRKKAINKFKNEHRKGKSREKGVNERKLRSHGACTGRKGFSCIRVRPNMRTKSSVVTSFSLIGEQGVGVSSDIRRVGADMN